MSELRMIKMSEIQPEPVRWLWEPYIPTGAITLLQGDGSAGKTAAALAIAAAVSIGAALPGSSRTAPARVIIQNAEDSYPKTIKPRLELSGADCSMIESIAEDGRELTFSDERIEQSIERTGATLCIFDPVQAYIGGANMNSANGVRPLMKRLGDIAARHGCAMLIVGHLSKKSGQSQYRGLGSIDIFAAARSVLTVGRSDACGDSRIIVNNKNNLAPAGSPQTFSIDASGRLAWLGECDATIDELLGNRKKPDNQFAKARKLVETALANGSIPAAEMMQMAEEQSISPKTLNRAKDALGVISVKRGDRWHWELPIDVIYEEIRQEGQHGQHGQDCQHSQHGQGIQHSYYHDGCAIGKVATNALTILTSIANLKEAV